MSELVTLPLVKERHELKYAIPVSLAEPICGFIKPYCSLDEHSAAAADNNYLIQSLYLDTRSLQFLKQRMYGKNGRFNIRVRCYGEEARGPFFLEIKNKLGTTGVKYRATVSDEEWPAILTDPSFRVDDSDKSLNAINKAQFLRTAISYDVRPHILTRYMRRAFISDVDSYARVTLDTSMSYCLQNSFSFIPDGDMAHYDNETIYGDFEVGPENLILELKCNIGEVPLWMLDLISTFGLRLQGFSKYMNSSLVAHWHDGVQYMNRDRKPGW